MGTQRLRTSALARMVTIPPPDGQTFAEKGFTKKSWSDKWICLQI